MDADNQKAECGREHHRRATLFHDAEKKAQQLEEKHRRAIIKARPYFELLSYCDQKLSTQKERVECLKKAVKDAKQSYSRSFRALEDISNQIHQQRRDYGNNILYLTLLFFLFFSNKFYNMKKVVNKSTFI